MNASSSDMEEKNPKGQKGRGQWTESRVVLTLAGPRVINPEVKGSTWLLLHICDRTAHNDSRAI